MKSAVIVVTIVCAFLFEARGDFASSAEKPWVTTSEQGDHLFKMIPAKWHFGGDKKVTEREAFAVAYAISDDGEFREMWRAEGWYAFEGYLSEDGRYFVGFGPWASDLTDRSDLAVAFYNQGKLLREYQVKELIKKPELLEESVSHYEWRPQRQTKPNGFDEEIFHLVLIDKTTLNFDFKTGEIVSTGRDKGAKSQRELFLEEEAAANKRGRDLFDASPLQKIFSRDFEISNINATIVTSISGCSLEGDIWRADLTPKEKLAHDATVAVVLPVIEGKRIAATITPSDLLKVFRSAFAHPYIARRFNDFGAIGIRLRTQGDRLHWDTPQLIEFLAMLTGTKPKGNELAHWAYLIIDEPEHRMPCLYLNTKTGELISEETLEDADAVILWDEAGHRKEMVKTPRPGSPQEDPFGE